MAINTQQFENAVERFNKKFGVNFTFKSLQAKEILYDNMLPSNAGDAAYNVMFAEMYKQALLSYVDGKIEKFNSLEMFNSFEDLLMSPYREECKKEGLSGLSQPYGGRTPTQVLETMNSYIDQTPKSQVDIVARKIANRELRLRDIRQMASEIDTNSTEDLTKIANCIAALEKVNEGRSRVWRFFHRVQNNAEKRDLKNLKEQFNYESISKYANDSTIRIDDQKKLVETELQKQKSIEDKQVEGQWEIEKESLEDAIPKERIGYDKQFDAKDYANTSSFIEEESSELESSTLSID
jgi:hypothetical protein